MSLDPRSFLATVAGYTRRTAADTSADRPVRLATVDPDYTGTGAPKVTFDGESTLSSKLYAFIDSYIPAAGDRVVLTPIGTTYIIVGKISAGNTPGPAVLLGYEPVEAGQDSISTETDLTGLSVTVTTKADRKIQIEGYGLVSASSAGSRYLMRIKEGSTTIQQWIGTSEVAVVAGTTADPKVILPTASIPSPSAGSHTYKLSLELITGTGTVGLVANSTAPAFIAVKDLGAA